jgi:LytS/YehU family sensor histidine kinase
VSAGQLLGRIPPGTDVLLQESSRTFVAFLHFDPVFYWIIIGLSYLMQQYQESRERELRASQLETQLAEARLQALEMQIHPHFLFNALHTIAVLVRTSRNAHGTQLVPLKAELEFIERYLEIEQIRFGDRLKVEISIETQTRDACVPYLILQPLVENAIQHGIAARATAGRLQITARLDGDRLCLAVHDDGPGLPETKDAPSGSGLGISTTQERLQQIYGADHGFTIRDVDDGGVTAELVLPYRLATDELEREA